MRSLAPHTILLAVILTAIFFGGLQVSLASDEQARAPVNLTPPGQPVAWHIPEGNYLYKFRWNGIPAAESEVAVNMETIDGCQCYRIKGTARTSRLADLLWKFRASIEAVVDSLTGRAKKIHTSERQRSRVKETETSFFYDSGEAHYTRSKKGKVKKKTLTLDDGVIDAATLGLILSYHPMDVGDSDKFTVLYGDDKYAVEYEVTGREQVTAAGKEYDTFRLEPRFHKIQKKEKPPKVSQMTLWLSEESPRLPIRMRSRTLIGHVTGRLVKITPAESIATNLHHGDTEITEKTATKN